VIDFRYHLVSLISVFLALAVGVILGAGPLQGAIGDQLTDQVEALRTERNALREELDQTQVTLEHQEQFALAAGTALLGGSLEGARVAVVDVDGLGDGVEHEILDRIEEANATLVAHETLAESWTTPDQVTLRQTVANGLRDQLVERLGTEALGEEPGPAAVLGAALAVSLTEADAADSSALSQSAAELQEALVSVGLVEEQRAPSAPADVVLLLSSGVTQEETAEETAGAEADPAEVGVAALATLAGAAVEVTDGLVVAGPGTREGDLVSALRGQEELSARLSTVTGIDQPVGQVVVPLALAAQRAGQVGQYGFEDGAAVLPPVVESPTPDVPVGAGEG
jgi:hypothetical protein